VAGSPRRGAVRLAVAGCGGTLGIVAIGGFGDAEVDRFALTVSDDLELDALAHLGIGRHALKLAVVLDRHAVERYDDVVLLDTCGGRGTTRVHPGDDRASRFR